MAIRSPSIAVPSSHRPRPLLVASLVLLAGFVSLSSCKSTSAPTLAARALEPAYSVPTASPTTPAPTAVVPERLRPVEAIVLPLSSAPASQPTLISVSAPASRPGEGAERLASLQRQMADLQGQLQSQSDQAARGGDQIRSLQEQASNNEEQLRALRDRQDSLAAHGASIEEARLQRATWYGQAEIALAQADETLMTGTPEVDDLLSAARDYVGSAAGSAATQGNGLEAANGQRALESLGVAGDSLTNSDLAAARSAIAAANWSVVAARAAAEGYAVPVDGP